MADQDPINPNEGSGDDGAPQIAVLTQYIKDLSVESPNSPAVFQWQAQPQLDVQFSINVNNIAEDVHEVMLKINVAAKSDNGAHFLIDLSYAGLFGIRNLPEEAVARSCWSKPRACCSRSPARSSPKPSRTPASRP